MSYLSSDADLLKIRSLEHRMRNPSLKMNLEINKLNMLGPLIYKPRSSSSSPESKENENPDPENLGENVRSLKRKAEQSLEPFEPTISKKKNLEDKINISEFIEQSEWEPILSDIDQLPNFVILDEDMISIIAHYKPLEKKTVFYLNDIRKTFMMNIFKNLSQKKRIDVKESKMLTGSQGIGKSYSLNFLAYYLRTCLIKDKIKLVYIKDCSLLNTFGYKAFLNELSFAFPEENLQWNSLNSDKAMNLIHSFKNCNDQEYLQWNCLNDNYLAKCLIQSYHDQGYFTILICDQLNSLKNSQNFNFDQIFQLDWTLQILSQSANNYYAPENDKILKLCSLINFDNIINQNSLQELLLKYKKNSQLLLNKQENYEKITGLVGNNPREAFLLLD